MALTAKNKAVIEDYVASGYKSMTESYHRVYTDATYESCSTNGYKIFKKPEAIQYMRDIQRERYERLNISAERIAEELAKMAFGDVSDTLKNSDKARALDLLQKQLGLQTQKVQADVKNDVVINIQE